MHHIDVKSLGICFVYCPSFCALQERTMAQYSTIYFLWRSLSSQTHFLNPPMEALVIHLFCSASSLLLLAIVEPRDLNLFTWVSTWPSICMSSLMSWDPGGGWYITLIFLRLIFSPNALADFENQVIISCASWVVVHCKGSVISKHEFPYQNIFGFSCRLKLTGIEQICPQSTVSPYFLGGISEAIWQDHREKKKKNFKLRTVWG